MTETEKSEYLDRLVLTYLHQNNQLTILEIAPEQERPKIFLENIGWGQQKDYIEDALNAYLSTSSPPLPEGKFYVFTPTDSFTYNSTTTRIDHASARIGDSSTFSEALNEILKQAKEDAAQGRGTLTRILFFDEASKSNFERSLEKKLRKKDEKSTGSELSYQAGLEEHNIPNYGKVKRYDYAFRLILQPNK
ncbi:hypothetical protein J4234_02435 [Candidatus Woesearchaeota archaeon]|nr:hypothetical protein [Candidatus Woesearchaeota archaeon]